MSAPPINDIDLSALSVSTPDINNIDLTQSSEVVNSATLEFTASGAGVLQYTGQGAATLEFAVAGEGGGGLIGKGSVEFALTASGSGYSDWLSKLPPIQLQEVYRLIITGAADGLADLYIGGISSWQATNQAGERSSYLQAVIPAADQYLADIDARKNGELVIQKGYRLAGGDVTYSEILRSRFDTLRPDRGRRSLTITVSGYQSGKVEASGTRALTGVRTISTSNGKRRVRCEIDLFLQPGMTVTALDQSFKADFINYYVNDSDKFCEVGER